MLLIGAVAFETAPIKFFYFLYLKKVADLCVSGRMVNFAKSVKEIVLIIYAPPNGARGTSAPLFKILDYEYRL